MMMTFRKKVKQKEMNQERKKDIIKINLEMDLTNGLSDT